MKHLFRTAVFLLTLSLGTASVQAQMRKIPSKVTDAFTAKYPDATGVEWRDKVSEFSVVFTSNGVKYDARYNGKGKWLNTESEVPIDNLPAPVKEGIEKSKYSDWEAEKAHRVDRPDKVQYRVQVGKSGVQKKNLIFDDKGKLLKDNVTL